MRVLKKAENVKNETVHAHSPFSAFRGNPVFWDVMLRPPKGPQKGKKARPPFLCESLFHRGPNRTFFEKKTRFLRNWKGSVRAPMTLCLLWPSSSGCTRALFLWFRMCFHDTNSFWRQTCNSSLTAGRPESKQRRGISAREAWKKNGDEFGNTNSDLGDRGQAW